VVTRRQIVIMIARPLFLVLAGFTLAQFVANRPAGVWSVTLGPTCLCFAVGVAVPFFEWFERWERR
jgi:hypothetical protein